METNPTGRECQIYSVPRMAEPLTVTAQASWLLRRLKRIAKRRVSFLRAALAGRPATSRAAARPAHEVLRAGDVVRVKSRAEIEATLDRWNQLGGCTFMEEMLPYCNTTQRVFKRVERFLDERDYRTKKTRGIVLLQGLLCEGTKDFGPCDRSCYFFWREEWLEKVG
jgi:hypothetical protein